MPAFVVNGVRRHLVFFAVSIFLLVLLGPATMNVNEVDALPVAKQFVDRHWLPADWYLNRPVAYRNLFNWIVGPLCAYLPFPTVSTIGRIAVATGFGYIIERYCVTFGLNGWLMLPWTLFFFRHQSLVAGEWMLDAFETKPLSYFCALLALPALHRRQYSRMLAWLGLAFSFHALVGAYAGATVAILLATDRRDRSSWPLLLRRSWIVALTGAFGLYAVLIQILPDGLSRAQALRAAEIYVRYRNPHHVWPGAWGHYWRWGAGLAVWTGLLIIGALRRDDRSRLLARYALFSLTWFALGYAFYLLEETSLLRYYWFRLPDTLVPFLGSGVVVLAASDLLRRLHGPNPSQSTSRRAVAVALPLAATAVSILLVVLPWTLTARLTLAGVTIRPRTWLAPRIPPAMTWIRQNTSRDAIFLVDPSYDRFYISAERPMFAAWKHGPQGAPDLLEWFDRLSMLNGYEPQRKGFPFRDELRSNYQKIDERRIRVILQKYRLDYCVVPARITLPFVRVYADRSSAIYALR